MLRLLRFLFTGSWHTHTYEIIRTLDIYTTVFGRRSAGPTAEVRVLQCTECGIVKRKRIDYS